MIVSPDSSNTLFNTCNLPGSPLRNIRMVQVQECSQSQSLTYQTSTTQYPHIAVVTNKAMINNNNNNDYKIHNESIHTSPKQYSQNNHHTQDYSKPIQVDLNHQHHHQNIQYQKYPVMDTTVASSTAAKGDQDLNIGMFMYKLYMLRNQVNFIKTLTI